jgi:hypothetical protein
MEPDPSATPPEPPTEPAPVPVPPVPPEPGSVAAPAPLAAPPPPEPPAPPRPPTAGGGPGGPTGPRAAAGSAPAGRTPPLPQLVTELRDLVVTYVKQQTIVPLKQLGRYIGFGIGGSLLLGFGVVFLALAGLRALQTETGGTFADDWSWVPYVIMIVVLAIGAAVVWLLRSTRPPEEKEAR